MQTRTLDPSTFQFLTPTPDQIQTMEIVRKRFLELASYLEVTLPPGADKTYLMRKLREVAMWASVSITRQSDGSPRNQDQS